MATIDTLKEERYHIVKTMGSISPKLSTWKDLEKKLQGIDRQIKDIRIARGDKNIA